MLRRLVDMRISILKIFVCLFVAFSAFMSAIANERSHANEKSHIDLSFLNTDGDFSVYVEKLLQSTKPAIDLFRANDLGCNLDSIKSVFYPFGGPDVVYPMCLFQEAETFVLVGLEYPGMSGYIGEKHIDIDKAKKDLSTLIEKSFFITNKMSKAFSKAIGNSATILLQLKTMGIVNVDLEFLHEIAGLCYHFNYKGKSRKIYYIKANLDDAHFAAHVKDIVYSLQEPRATMFKAASYLPHNNHFSKLRSFCTEVSNVILQDDSGLPYKYLGDFNVKLWGPYIKPYGVEFLGFKQDDLLSLNADRSIGFCFGYGCGKQPAVLMVASKKTHVVDHVK